MNNMEPNGLGDLDFTKGTLSLNGNENQTVSRGPSMAAMGGAMEADHLNTLLEDAARQEEEARAEQVTALGEQLLAAQKKAAEVAEQIRLGEAEYAQVTDPGIQAIRQQILAKLQEEKNGYLAQQTNLREEISNKGGNPDKYNLH